MGSREDYEKMLDNFDLNAVHIPKGVLKWPPVAYFQESKSNEELERLEREAFSSPRKDSESLEVASFFFGED